MSKVDNLAKLVERLGQLGPLDDEHHRYSLYMTALAHPDLWPLLRECLADEPDTNMATSVVVAAFEVVPPDERLAWGVLVSRDRSPDGTVAISAFLTRRVAEHENLDLVIADPSAVTGVVDRLSVLSPTFERRLVALSASREVQVALATNGTRRTRHEARHRLRDLGGTDTARPDTPR